MKNISRLMMMVGSMAMLFYACGPSVEGESSAWETNTAKLKGYAVEYPVLKDTLMQDLAKAEEQYKAAMDLQDEKAKIAGLQAANATISKKGAMKAILEFKTNSDLLMGSKQKLEKIESKYFTDKTAYLINQAKVSLQNFNEVDKKNFESASAAIDEMNRTSYDLLSVYHTLDNYYTKEYTFAKMDDKFKEDSIARANKQVAKGQSDTSSASAEATATAVAVSIKCSKCGTMNDANATECTGCKATLTSN